MASPNAARFRAAFTSRSEASPHCVQTYVRSDRASWVFSRRGCAWIVTARASTRSASLRLGWLTLRFRYVAIGEFLNLPCLIPYLGVHDVHTVGGATSGVTPGPGPGRCPPLRPGPRTPW